MAIKLPLLQAADPVVNRYQNLLQTALSPVLSNPAAIAHQVSIKDANGLTTMNIPLLAAVTPNIIPIGLQSPLVGYSVRLKGEAIVWDTQDSNKTPADTLYLNTSVDVVIQLMVW